MTQEKFRLTQVGSGIQMSYTICIYVLLVYYSVAPALHVGVEKLGPGPPKYEKAHCEIEIGPAQVAPPLKKYVPRLQQKLPYLSFVQPCSSLPEPPPFLHKPAKQSNLHQKLAPNGE